MVHGFKRLIDPLEDEILRGYQGKTTHHPISNIKLDRKKKLGFYSNFKDSIISLSRNDDHALIFLMKSALRGALMGVVSVPSYVYYKILYGNPYYINRVDFYNFRSTRNLLKGSLRMFRVPILAGIAFSTTYTLFVDMLFSGLIEKK